MVGEQEEIVKLWEQVRELKRMVHEIQKALKYQAVHADRILEELFEHDGKEWVKK